MRSLPSGPGSSPPPHQPLKAFCKPDLVFSPSHLFYAAAMLHSMFLGLSLREVPSHWPEDPFPISGLSVSHPPQEVFPESLDRQQCPSSSPLLFLLRTVYSDRPSHQLRAVIRQSKHFRVHSIATVNSALPEKGRALPTPGAAPTAWLNPSPAHWTAERDLPVLRETGL